MVFQKLHLLFKMGKEYNHQKIKDSGLSETECIICSFVISHEDCTQDDVVQAFHIDKTTIAKAMVTLEEKGFIERKQSADDKRKKVLKLTAVGKKATLAIGDLHEKWFEQVLSVLSPDEQKTFENYCDRLLEAAKKSTTSC